MAGDTGIFATTAEVIRKAGANASATSAAEAYINDYMTQIESSINDEVRFNFSDNYADLDVDVKGILKEVASNLAAIYVIAYEPGDFNSVPEARFIVDILFDRAQKLIKQLKEKEVQDFMNKA